MPDYDIQSDIGRLRLLLNDVDTTPDGQVFDDDELQAFLDIEGGHLKLAAAQAIDTNADNELLASKVLRTQDLQTDGAKVADALRARAKALRDQHYSAIDDADDGYFGIVDASPSCGWL